jgi:hypothetical protein
VTIPAEPKLDRNFSITLRGDDVLSRKTSDASTRLGPPDKKDALDTPAACQRRAIRQCFHARFRNLFFSIYRLAPRVNFTNPQSIARLRIYKLPFPAILRA